MASDLPDSPILAEEQGAITRLARETHSTIARVQEVFLEEYKRLAAGAHIKVYLPLLTGNLVRTILNEENTATEEIPKL